MSIQSLKKDLENKPVRNEDGVSVGYEGNRTQAQNHTWQEWTIGNKKKPLIVKPKNTKVKNYSLDVITGASKLRRA